MKGAKKGAKPRAQRKPRRKNYGILKHDVAQVTANLGQTTVPANVPLGMYNFSLSNAARASAVAAGYQYYRIRQVTLKVKPLYDTFQLGANSTVTLPYLYYMIDRHYTFPANTTVATLKQSGAKPHRLDDKTITIRFRPSVINASIVSSGSGAATTQYGAGTYRISPWLSTNANNNGGGSPTNPPGSPGVSWKPDSTDHQGILLFIEQNTVPTPNAVATVEYMVEYEFKKRLWEPPASQVATLHTVNLDTLELVPPPETDVSGNMLK